MDNVCQLALTCPFRASCYGTRLSILVVTLLEFSEREEGVVAIHLPLGPLKNLLWVGAATEIQT